MGILMDVSLIRWGDIPGILAACMADSTALPVPELASHMSIKSVFCLTVIEAILLRGTTEPSFRVTLIPSSRATCQPSSGCLPLCPAPLSTESWYIEAAHRPQLTLLACLATKR